MRRALMERATARLRAYDAVLMPTVPIVPPRIADLEADDDLFGRTNLLVLRNPTTVNMIDGCAISLPLGAADGAPVGLTVAGIAATDRSILAVAAAVEAELGTPPS